MLMTLQSVNITFLNYDLMLNCKISKYICSEMRETNKRETCISIVDCVCFVK